MEEPPLQRPTFPLSHSTRKKPRRWPLVLRVWKGSIHWEILPAVLLHAAFTTLIVWLEEHRNAHLSLPGTIVPSLSIVVGLMLVFRNGTSYDRFWAGRNHLTTIVTSVRNLSRTFLVCSAPFACGEDEDEHEHEVERQDTETTVRILIAILYAVKHNLRAEWRSHSPPPPSRASTITSNPGGGTPRHHSRNPSGGVKRPKLFRNESGMSIFHGAGLPQSFYTDEENTSSPKLTNFNPFRRGDQTPRSPGDDLRRSALLHHADSGLGNMSSSASTLFNINTSIPQAQRPYRYGGLLPEGLGDFEDRGLSLPIQLSVLVESYIHRQVRRGRLTPPQAASQLGPQLNTLVDAFARMETIRTTPLPVAHLIHTKQVLTLYLIVLPFTMVADMSWWAIPIVALVAFTLYGIEGIGRQLEDPFGYDRNDIKLDGIVEDARVEGMVLLGEWRRGGEMFAQPW
ncbi:UPF0187-domain-containing protein [Rhizodiscina lignyota]|uniref:UPF0187-domain-containing protein n=1 Tax=Rhizodiscina lignyota TaxID=1504668 RepID=A0A9P4IRU6_9PEZI|nr:UPF0187-domain-containing protein [Rhizodiscina lignyota]